MHHKLLIIFKKYLPKPHIKKLVYLFYDSVRIYEVIKFSRLAIKCKNQGYVILVREINLYFKST